MAQSLCVSGNRLLQELLRSLLNETLLDPGIMLHHPLDLLCSNDILLLPARRIGLGSNPSAAAGDEGMRAGTPQLYLFLSHAFVLNAVNPGGTGGWPP